MLKRFLPSEMIAYPPENQGVKKEDKEADRFSNTMFYVNYTSNLGLSKMADHKAHILIRINVLLLSFFIAKTHLGILANLHGYTIPNLFLALTCTISILLAIMVAKPNVSPPKKEGQPVNWFFFGDFQHYSLDAFHKAIFDLQSGKKVFYEAMSRDLYWMGLSLARKYRMLRAAYTVFLFGHLSVLCLYIAFFLWRHWS